MTEKIYFVPRGRLQLSINFSSLVKIIEVDAHLHGTPRKEFGLVTIKSERHIHREFDNQKMIDCLKDNVDEVARIMKEENKGGPVAMILPSITHEIKATSSGAYETQSKAFAFFFPEYIPHEMLEKCDNMSLDGVVALSKSTAQDTVNNYPDSAKFVPTR